ncbi:MAG TPA: sulfotransferase [Actinomycetota bacterium]|nr:sulfotransferase [Actinomycetota bacterium]
MSPTPPEPLPAFPFVVGEARSGTTLLRVMLDAHPQLSIPPESYFVSGLYPYRSRYERNGSFDLARFAGDLQGLHKFRDWDLDANVLGEVFASPMPRGTYADAIRLLYGTYATAHDKPRYGDKSPGYVTRMKLLVQLFPEARFVHIVRDVRSVALSLTEMPAEWGTRTVPEGAARWRHRVSRGHTEGTALGPDRYLEVRYEDLVGDAEQELRRLVEFLLLPWDDAVLHYADRGLSRVPEGSHDIHGNVASAPKATRDWRSQISPEDLEVVEAIAGDVMTEMGYERAVPDPSPASRQQAAAVIGEWDDYLRRKKRKGRLRRRIGGLRPGRSQPAE